MSCKVLQAVCLAALAAWLAALPRPAAVAEPQQSGVYVVNSNKSTADANPGDGICATPQGECTLRAAIQEANLDGAGSSIKFASRFQGTNAIADCLPPLTTMGTSIDASDQWDAAADRPGVEISSTACHLLTIDSDVNSVRGILFAGSGATGIHITGGGQNRIGGTHPSHRNVFLTDIGVRVSSPDTENSIRGNYFGTANGQISLGVGKRGVAVGGGQSLTIIENNLIVGQSEAGIILWAGNNVVRENIIGLDKDQGKALPNAKGIIIIGEANTIGPDNVIAGNTGYGLEIYHGQHNHVYGNTIGGTRSRGLENGSDGIHIKVGAENIIDDGNYLGNTIGANNGYGIRVLWSTKTTIQGNTILDNSLGGIYLQTGAAQVGGTTEQERNVIIDNGGDGIHLDAANSVTVTGNYIGLNLGVYDGGNQGYGILVDNGAHDNRIGGGAAGEGNLIGYNHKDGIHLGGSNTSDNYILGNVIGAAVGWRLEAPNGWHGIGLYDGTYDNVIGALGAGNTIVANSWSGVAIVNSSGNVLVGNQIGTTSRGLEWGNVFYGVSIVGNSADNGLIFNEIAFNGTHDGPDQLEAGVLVQGPAATGNSISMNSIHDNDGPGIKLDDGGNTNLPEPAITAASCHGVVEGTACPGCTVEIFSDDADEGRYYESTVTADPTTGAFAWGGPPNGPHVTATARDGNENTSPFSAPFDVGACNTAPTAAFTVNPSSGDTTTVFQFDASGSSDAEDATADLQVRWDWEGDGFYDTAWSNNKVASHRYTSADTYTVVLEVQDTGGLTDVATQQLTVSAAGASHRSFLPLVLRRR